MIWFIIPVVINLCSFGSCFGAQRSGEDDLEFFGPSAKCSVSDHDLSDLESILNDTTDRIDLPQIDPNLIEGSGQEGFLALLPQLYKGDASAFGEVICGIESGAISSGSISFKEIELKHSIIFTAAHVFIQARYERLKIRDLATSKKALWWDSNFQFGLSQLQFCYVFGLGTKVNNKAKEILENYQIPEGLSD